MSRWAKGRSEMKLDERWPEQTCLLGPGIYSRSSTYNYTDQCTRRSLYGIAGTDRNPVDGVTVWTVRTSHDMLVVS